MNAFGIEVQVPPVVNHLGQEPREAVLGFLCVLLLRYGFGEKTYHLGRGVPPALCSRQINSYGILLAYSETKWGRKAETRQQPWVLHVIFAATFTPTHRVGPFFLFKIYLYFNCICVCERVKVPLDPTGAAVTGGREASQCGC